MISTSAVLLRRLTLFDDTLKNLRSGLDKGPIIEYASTSAALIAQIQALNADASQAWEAYTARSTALYESMADDLYHEYTVVFPEEGQTALTFYIRHSVERSRVEMFLQQPRIKTMEELLLDVGFHEEWIDAVVDKGLSLQE